MGTACGVIIGVRGTPAVSSEYLAGLNTLPGLKRDTSECLRPLPDRADLSGGVVRGSLFGAYGTTQHPAERRTQDERNEGTRDAYRPDEEDGDSGFPGKTRTEAGLIEDGADEGDE